MTNFAKTFFKNPKIQIFLTSIAIRIILSLIFFGSIDIVIQLRDTPHAIGNQLFGHYPYFPVIPVFMWVSGLLAEITSLPLTLCCKVFQILFDSLLALLIYEIILKKNEKLAYKAGMLYAICPIALLINCFHGQWDSICLFFLILSFYIRDYFKDSFKRNFIFGVLFTISFLVKPYTLVFAVVFFQPFKLIKKNGFKKYLFLQFASVLGMVLTSVIFFSYFVCVGYSIPKLFEAVFKYSNVGVQVFGLPFNRWFVNFPIFQKRLYIVIITAAISLFYYFGRMGIFNYVLFVFAVTIGMTGICPQYMIWVVPFLILTLNFRFAAVYNVVVTAFLLLYYINPYTSPEDYENMATFATLNSFSWLMPPTLFSTQDWVSVIKILGNIVFPATSLLIGGSVLVKSIIKKETPIQQVDLIDEQDEAPKEIDKRETLRFFANPLLVTVLNISLVTIALKLIVYFLGNIDSGKVNETIGVKIMDYNIDKLNPDSHIYVGNFESFSGFSVLNIVFLLGALALVWSVISIWLNTKNDNKATIEM